VDRYAAWLVVAAVPTWLSMADVGFGAVAANEMALRAAREDWRGVEAVFQSAWAAILFLSALAVAIVVPAVVFGDWARWLSLSAPPASEIAWALGILGFVAILAFQGNISAGLFRAEGRADLAIWIGGARPFVDLVCVSLALLVSRTLVAAAIGLLTSQVFVLGFGTWLGLRLCPKVAPGFSRCRWDEVLYCLRKGFAFTIFPLGNAISLQGSTLVVNHVLGTQAVVIFNTCRTMMRSAQQLMNLIGQSAWPEFSRLVGEGDLPRARKLHHLTFAFNVALAVAVSAVLIACGPVLYSYWTGRNLQVDHLLILAFSSGVIGNAIWFASSTIVAASNRHERLALFFLVAALAALPACYFFARSFGIYGAAWSVSLIDLLLAPLVLGQALVVTRESAREFFTGTFSSLADVASSVVARVQRRNSLR
jgi:O-antigen/teichoic acid export membrane protein